MKRWIVTAACALSLTVAAAPAAAAGCPSVSGNFGASGPFSVTTSQSGAGHTIYRPASLGSLGCTTHPVIVWGNGTGVTPSIYNALLTHLASHGFIVAAANTTQSGSGQAMLAGITYLAAQNTTAGSPYFGKVDTANVAATGHSQGGGGAIAAGADPRITVTVPIEPGPQGDERALHGPTLWLAGQFDWVVWPNVLVRPRYQNATQVVGVYGNLKNATHSTPAGNGGGFRAPITAWMRFWMMGDEQARGLFFGANCSYCSSSSIWVEYLRNAKALAVPGA